MKRKTKRAPTYSAEYRAEHGLVQLNCSIPREIKEKLDDILNLTGKTTADFITDSITALATTEAPKETKDE